MTELKPCPFCGGDPSVSTYETESLWSHNTVTYTKVECGECDIGFNTEPGHELQAADAWNRRADPAEREADELTEDEILRRAKALVLAKGWKPGDRPGLHSVAQLMLAFGLELIRKPPTDRCAYPECGCDWDAVCNAASSKMKQGPKA